MKKFWNNGVKLYHLSVWSSRVLIVLLFLTAFCMYGNWIDIHITLVTASILMVLSFVAAHVSRRAWKLLQQDAENGSQRNR